MFPSCLQNVHSVSSSAIYMSCNYMWFEFPELLLLFLIFLSLSHTRMRVRAHTHTHMYSIPQTIKKRESVTSVNNIAYISAQVDSSGDASNSYKGGAWFKILTGISYPDWSFL
jgi:hypothetical protein